MQRRCDSCEHLAPDVVAEILCGIYGWRSFEIDGEKDGRKYTASVLLCGNPSRSGELGRGCASKMQAFVDSGGNAGIGPTPPDIRTFRGGQCAEPDWAERSDRVRV